MGKFEVEIREIESYRIEVEIKDGTESDEEIAAEERALEILESCNNKDTYYQDSDLEFEVRRI